MRRFSLRGRPERLWLGLLAIGATVLTAGAVVLTSSQAYADSTGSLRGAGSNRCLDDPNGSTTNGVQMQIYDCWGGSPQQWTYTSSGQLQVVGKCLDAYNKQTTPGTKVEIWDCNGGTNQQWRLNSDGTITGVQSGLCLDVTGGATAGPNGTKLELWPCTGQANEIWTAV